MSTVAAPGEVGQGIGLLDVEPRYIVALRAKDGQYNLYLKKFDQSTYERHIVYHTTNRATARLYRRAEGMEVLGVLERVHRCMGRLEIA